MTRSEQDTRAHIGKVRYCMAHIIANLSERANVHDLSKLEEPELSGYQGLSDALAGLTYGTPEHRAAFAPFKEIIAHHYASNTHHPEHWVNGIADMSLFDIIEMLADWKAAGERTKDGSMVKSLEVNFSRFCIDDEMQHILINTARELGWIA